MQFLVVLTILSMGLSVEAGTYTLKFEITVPTGVLNLEGKQLGKKTVTKTIVEGEVSKEFTATTARGDAKGRIGYAIPLTTLVKELNLDLSTLKATVWDIVCSKATLSREGQGTVKLAEVTVISDVTAESVDGTAIATVTPEPPRKPFELIQPYSLLNLVTFARYVFISWNALPQTDKSKR